MSSSPKTYDTDEMNRWVNDAIKESIAIPYDPIENATILRRRQIMERIVEFKELLMMNACAIKEIRTKLEILNTEFNLRYHRNPIHSINTRLKSVASIAAKMEKYGKPFTVEDIDENMHDIAGVRVICPYIDDIYTIADAILRQDDITYVTKKDYIRSPKPNGYRSLHLIVRVPVFFADRRKDMTVEIQIRTIAMDFWASLEHQLRYKDDGDIGDDLINKLRECAITINETDREMLDIRRQLEKIADKQTEEEALMEKFAKIDMSLM